MCNIQVHVMCIFKKEIHIACTRMLLYLQVHVIYTSTHNIYICTSTRPHEGVYAMGWLRLVGSLKL